MNVNNSLTIINTLTLDTPITAMALKIGILFLELMYVLYSFIVIRQVSIMNKNYTAELAHVFRVGAKLQFFATIVVFVLTLILVH